MLLFDSTLMGRIFHIDEVDDDQAAEVTQTHLTRNFFSSFFIGVEGSGFDVSAGRGAAELTSMATRASVWSITIEPPEGRGTVLE